MIDRIRVMWEIVRKNRVCIFRNFLILIYINLNICQILFQDTIFCVEFSAAFNYGLKLG